MTQRIKAIEETDAPIILKPLYVGFKKIAGRVGASLKVQAHRPSNAWFGNLFGIAIEKSRTVERRVYLLTQLRATQIVECPFYIDIIPALGKNSGVLTDAEINQVSHYFDSDLFSIKEKGALEMRKRFQKRRLKFPTKCLRG